MNQKHLKRKLFTLAPMGRESNCSSATSYSCERGVGKNLDRATECAMTSVGENNKIPTKPNQPSCLAALSLAASSETNHSPLTTHYSLKRKTAFTLAEVLITLGIIGIVAALTLPQLVSNYQKRVVPIRLKKMYNTLWNAISMAEAENGPTENWTFEDDDKAREFYKTQIRSRMKCVDRKINKNYYFKDMNCSLPDGSFIVLNNFRSYGLLEIIFYPLGDMKSINYAYGISANTQRRTQFTYNVWLAPRRVPGGALPAKTEVTAMSIPVYSLTRDKLLNGPGSPSDPYCKLDSGGAAVACFQLIKRDSWVIKNDYPW